MVNEGNEKHQTFNRWKESQSIECFNNYKTIRNKVNRELKSAADSYAQSIFEDLPDSKQKWKFIKNRLQTNVRKKSYQKSKKTIKSLMMN